jgi:hypothetical protein
MASENVAGKEKKFSFPAGIWTLNDPAHHLVIVSTALSWLLHNLYVK